MSDLRIVPLTPDLIPAFTTLFGPQGACYGCWCTHFRLRPKVRQALTGDDRRDLMLARIGAGPPPGLIALEGDDPVGWMQIGPRADVPEWNNPGRVSSPLPDAPADDPGVWAVSCFFFRSGARLLEAAPMDRAKQSKSVGLFVGSTSVFTKAGFQTVATVKPGRPLMRLQL